MNYKECKVVAEACCNHKGNFDIALEMIKFAKLAGADYIKFQKRNPIEAIPKKWHKEPHPNPINAFGETYLEHRKKLEFTFDQHVELKKYCDSLNIGYACSIWDISSAKEIISLKPDFIKIPSACNTRYDILSYIYKGEYKGDLHISLGMISLQERKDIYNYLSNNKVYDRTVLYWTTTEYPVPFEKIYLLEIKKIKENIPCKEVGYSGHHLGIAADVSAFTLGADWVERHFTLDRTWKGTDQAASLEMGGLQKLCRDLKAVKKALDYKGIGITEKEKENRDKLKVIK